MQLNAASSMQAGSINYGFFSHEPVVRNGTQQKLGRLGLSQTTMHGRCAGNIRGYGTNRSGLALSFRPSLMGYTGAELSKPSFSNGVAEIPSNLLRKSEQTANSEINRRASSVFRMKASNYADSMPVPQHPSPGDEPLSFDNSQSGGIPQPFALDQNDVKNCVSAINDNVELLSKYTHYLQNTTHILNKKFEDFIFFGQLSQPKPTDITESTGQSNSRILKIQNELSAGFGRVAQVVVAEGLNKEIEKQTLCLQPMKSLYERTQNIVAQANSKTLAEHADELETSFETMKAFLDTAHAFEVMRERFYAAVDETPDSLPDQENKNI